MMRKRFIATGQGLFILAILIAILGVVFQMQHNPKAENVYYIACIDAIIAIIILGACKFTKPKNS